MTQHAIQMVQRNLTPGGDKNGADINLALDALEMAFTRNHINAFVIVGGDSDFIALVEKLKQYDKKVLVVGGRAFTSTILQKNCHEFIAYENLIAPQPVQRRPTEKVRIVSDSDLSKALPLVRRALKVLTDREVSPQLGLLKSTLLQLDSTFSERDYGASTFRDFIEKMASAGFVKLKQVDRSLLVELKDQGEQEEMERETGPSEPPQAAETVQPAGAAPPPSGPTPDQIEEGVRAMQEAFQKSKIAPHWPMYLRNVKQYIKNASPTFDERRFGFHSFLEAVRHGQRVGLFRLERNRQGILRVFPGNQISQLQRPIAPPIDVEEPVFAPSPAEESIVIEEHAAVREVEPVLEAIPAEVIEAEAEPSVSAEPETQPPEKPARKRRASPGVKRKPATGKTRTGSTAARRSRKKSDSGTEDGSDQLPS